MVSPETQKGVKTFDMSHDARLTTMSGGHGDALRCQNCEISLLSNFSDTAVHCGVGLVEKQTSVAIVVMVM